MNYLLAASLPLVIKALQDWAVATPDVRTSTGDLLAVASRPAAFPRR